MIDRKTLIGLVLIIVLFYFAWPSLQKKAIEKPSPSFEYENMTGEIRSFASPFKDIQVLHFWATWCPICKLEWPEYTKIEQKYSVLHVAGASGSDSEVRAYLDENSLKSNNRINDKTGYILQLFSVRAYPSTIIVDKTGKIRFFKVGKVTAQEIDRVISELN